MAETKGRICVTGGTGYIASWMVKCLLENGYSVNATTRNPSGQNRDLSYLEKLPGAKERLTIFHSDLDIPESFAPAIQGCIGVFHTAHPLDFSQDETEEAKLKRVTSGLRGILKACADSKTVKRVVLTSSITAFALNGSSEIKDENSWSDVEFLRSKNISIGLYAISKTITEKLAFDLAEELGLDLVSIGPTWVTGPFICPHLPGSVYASLGLIYGDKQVLAYIKEGSLVHVEDVARAHIHLFEHHEAKGRYICVGVDVTIEDLHEFISKKYPQYKLPNPESWSEVVPVVVNGVSRKRLLETGFKYLYGLDEMFDGAIECCKTKGFL